jgi:hypothetical protein
MLTWKPNSRTQRVRLGHVFIDQTIPSPETLNREFFVEKVLTNFNKKRGQNRPKKHSRSTFLHLDHTIPHRALWHFDCLGIIRLLYLLYSQDLVLCDFWLFGMLKRKLGRCTFTNPVEVMMKINIILSKIPREEFILVFDEWKCRLCKYIDRGRKYL